MQLIPVKDPLDNSCSVPHYARVERDRISRGGSMIDALLRLAAEDALKGVAMDEHQLRAERRRRGNPKWRQDFGGDASELLGVSRQTVKRFAGIYKPRGATRKPWIRIVKEEAS